MARSLKSISNVKERRAVASQRIRDGEKPGGVKGLGYWAAKDWSDRGMVDQEEMGGQHVRR